jgi:hypothetical protein
MFCEVVNVKCLKSFYRQKQTCGLCIIATDMPVNVAWQLAEILAEPLHRVESGV